MPLIKHTTVIQTKCFWRSFFVATLSLCLSSIALAAELESVSLKLKWKHQFQFAGYYAAVEKGFYRDAGFDVTLIEQSGEIDLFDPVAVGDIEFGVADSSIVIKRLQGLPLVILTPVYQHSPLVLMSLKEKGILSPFELIGKRIMFRRNADDAAIQALLTSLGIEASDYELAPHSFNNQALIDSSPPIDAMSAYLGNQPFTYQQDGYDVQIIDPANYGIDFYGDLLFSSEQYVSNHPDRAIAFKDASLKGWEYALENPDEVISWLEDKYPANKDLAALRYEAEITRKMIAPEFVKLGSVYPARFIRIAEVYRKLGLAPKDSVLDGLILDDYLEQEAENTRKLFGIFGVAAILLLLLLGILGLIMRSLRNTIKRRTDQLNSVNEILTHQVKLTDRHVISAALSLDIRFVEVSTAFCKKSGYSRDELLQIDPVQLMPDYARSAYLEIIQRVFTGHSEQGDIKQIHKDGSYYWLHLYSDPVRNASGEITGLQFTASDITERKYIERLSEIDVLTGIANRKKLDSVLGREWTRYLRNKQEVTIILLDLDHFKQVNDNFGHTLGDEVLVAVASLMEQSVRDIDLVGRWGGEEFLVILPETNLNQAAHVAEKLRTAIYNHQGFPQLTLSASFGVAASSQVTELKALFRIADKALYRAKENGRNRVELATQPIQD